VDTAQIGALKELEVLVVAQILITDLKFVSHLDDLRNHFEPGSHTVAEPLRGL
jgi:hypothetical protein